MKLTVHLPRSYEADIHPKQREDILITPKFYQREGWVTVLPMTVTNKDGDERRFLLQINATHGRVQLKELVELVPVCEGAKVRDVRTAEAKPEGGE